MYGFRLAGHRHTLDFHEIARSVAPLRMLLQRTGGQFEAELLDVSSGNNVSLIKLVQPLENPSDAPYKNLTTDIALVRMGVSDVG